MSSDDSRRVRVSTYVPAHQKETWQADADDLDMSQSEFVRTMVQIGRRGFDVPSLGNGESVTDPNEDESAGGRETASPDANSAAGGAESAGDVERRVLDALATDAHLDWDDLLAELTADLEEELDDALGSLQADNRIRYSGRHGGYTLVEDDP